LTGGGRPQPPRGQRGGHHCPPLRPLPLCPALPRVRRRQARRGMAIATACRQGGRPRFLGPSRGGGRPEVAAAASTMVLGCCHPTGAAPSPQPHCPDGLTVTTVMTAPAWQPAVTPAMATPSGTMMPPLPPLPAKRTTRDRRITTAVATMGMVTRTMTSGGGTHTSTCPPHHHHYSSATSSAMPLPQPACYCWASQCP
jgi:hypothetical protein